MARRPLLIAAAAFVVVLVGGTALAGVGGHFGAGGEPIEAGAPAAGGALDVPEPTTTRVVADDAEPSAPPPKPTTTTSPATPAEPSPAKEPAATTTTIDTAAAVDPTFTITKPTDGARVTTKTVVFGGEARDVTIHRGRFTAEPDGGAWSMTLVVSPGRNVVTFDAVAADGTTSTKAVTVHYDPPKHPDQGSDDAKDTGKETGKDDQGDTKQVPGFSAAQKYGSCGDDVPYDVFYGTAIPGTSISVTSPHGSAAATADEKGRWKARVEFPGSPPGSTFEVTVSAATGESTTFPFTNTSGGDTDH